MVAVVVRVVVVVVVGGGGGGDALPFERAAPVRSYTQMQIHQDIIGC